MDKFLDWLYSKRIALLWVCLGIAMLCVLLTLWHFWPTFGATVELLDFQTFLPLVACNSRPPTPTLEPKSGIGFHRPYGAEDIEQFGAFWSHCWHPQPPPVVGVYTASMIWSSAQMYMDVTGTMYVDRRKVLQGPNECDQSAQCNETPEEGAVTWLHLESHYRGYYLVSPAPSQNDYDWLRQMWAAFYDLTGRYPAFDAIAVHCYQTTGDCREILMEAKAIADEFGGLPVWVTEFATLPLGTDDIPRQAQNLSILIEWLDAQDWIEYWSYFILYSDGTESWSFGHDLNPSLIRLDGSLTAFGKVFTGEYVAPMIDYPVPFEEIPLNERLKRRTAQ